MSESLTPLLQGTGPVCCGVRVWQVLLVGLSLLLAGLPGCAKEKRPAFSCRRYQARMERCESDLLVELRRRHDTDVKMGFGSPQQAAARLQRLQRKVRRRIRYRNSLRLCEKLTGRRDTSSRKRLGIMRYCLARSGCARFARCMLRLW